jgi:hypothetical protein
MPQEQPLADSIRKTAAELPAAAIAIAASRWKAGLHPAERMLVSFVAS